VYGILLMEGKNSKIVKKNQRAAGMAGRHENKE
jgi:hypothetical protein